MLKRLENLETLAPLLRFSNKRRQSAMPPRTEVPAVSFFAQRRERLDSEELREVALPLQRKLSDVLLTDPFIQTLRNIGDADNLHAEEDQCHAMLEERLSSVSIAEFVEKEEEKTQIGVDSFDFKVHKIKKSKNSKFVIKIGKNKESVVINNAKADARKRKSGTDSKETSVHEASVKDAGLNSNDKISAVLSEKQKIKIKIGKIRQYWAKSTLFTPNVFKLTQTIEDDTQHVLEFQDYSKKSVLAGCQKNKSEECGAEDDNEDDMTYFNEAVSFTHKQSFCQILGSLDDVLEF